MLSLFTCLYQMNIPKFMKKVENNSNSEHFNMIYARFKSLCVGENISLGRSYNSTFLPTDIRDCVFTRTLVFTSNGGVVYISNVATGLKISNTIFYHCITTGNGGSIYFNSPTTGKSFIIRYTCASLSLANYAQFSYSYISPDYSNQLEFCSINRCRNTTECYYPIGLLSGKQMIQNNNVSMNYVKSYSSFYCINTYSYECSFNNIVSNVAEVEYCYYKLNITGNVAFCNFIGNNSPSRNGVIHIASNSSIHFSYCIFKNNNNTLFHNANGVIFVSSSYIHHTQKTTSGDVRTSNSNNSFIDFPSYNIPFFTTHFCPGNDDQIEIPYRTYEFCSTQAPSGIPIVLIMISSSLIP